MKRTAPILSAILAMLVSFTISRGEDTPERIVSSGQSNVIQIECPREFSWQPVLPVGWFNWGIKTLDFKESGFADPGTVICYYGRGNDDFIMQKAPVGYRCDGAPKRLLSCSRVKPPIKIPGKKNP